MQANLMNDRRPATKVAVFLLFFFLTVTFFSGSHASTNDTQKDQITDGAPSSHILKTPIKDLHGTVENETFCMMLAKRMGLTVPDVKIFKINEIPLYLIDRYDRKIENGQIIRLIQEDFCQALNVNAQLKYSPTLDMCFSLIRNESASQVKDTKRFLQLIIFNGLIGNSDAHAKNISFLHGENGTMVTMVDRIVGEAKKTTEEFFDLYGESSVLYEINDVIKNSSKEKLKVFS